ncbi:MAG: energy transducer TonB [Zoogloeaceae bacterium]|jgi:protein TonB|nr:energy transducer TonB [Zoogloeaceae bacterium]
MDTAQPAISSALLVAGSLSICLHALPFLPSRPAPSPPAPPSISATLKVKAPPVFPVQPPPEHPLPELVLDAPEKTIKAPALRDRPPPPARTRSLPSRLRACQGCAHIGVLSSTPDGLPPGAAQSAHQQLSRLAGQEGFYPLEAVEQGLEGETWIRIFLDENGNVIAARTEQSSGHPILDQAAERAARALKSLPAGGLGDAVLPVRFRIE